MNRFEAEEIVNRMILLERPGCSIVDGKTREYSTCFAVYYQSSKYLQSSQDCDFIVGQGPVIVCKTTRSAIETGSSKSTDQYVAAFAACGDPSATRSTTIEVVSLNDGANKVAATKIFRKYSSLGLASSKKLTDSVWGGVPGRFNLREIDQADKVLSELEECGFNSRQLWSNQC